MLTPNITQVYPMVCLSLLANRISEKPVSIVISLFNQLGKFYSHEPYFFELKPFLHLVKSLNLFGYVL